MDSNSMISIVVKEGVDVLVVDRFFDSCIVERALCDPTIGWYVKGLGWW